MRPPRQDRGGRRAHPAQSTQAGHTPYSPKPGRTAPRASERRALSCRKAARTRAQSSPRRSEAPPARRVTAHVHHCPDHERTHSGPATVSTSDSGPGRQLRQRLGRRATPLGVACRTLGAPDGAALRSTGPSSWPCPGQPRRLSQATPEPPVCAGRRLSASLAELWERGRCLFADCIGGHRRRRRPSFGAPCPRRTRRASASTQAADERRELFGRKATGQAPRVRRAEQSSARHSAEATLSTAAVPQRQSVT